MASTAHAEIPFSSGQFVLVAQNPFTKPRAAEPRQQEHNDAVRDAPGWYRRLLAASSAWQRELRQRLSRQARHLKEEPFGPAFWSFLALAMGYGVLHALGPGHGKAFACSYFASRRAQVRQAAVTSAAMSVLHVLSAVALVGVGYFLLTGWGAGEMQSRFLVFQKISYAILAALGLVVAGTAVWGLAGRKHHVETCPGADKKSMLGLVLAVGLVPCPGAAIIFLFCLNMGLLEQGLAAMAALALGMAATTTAVAMAALACNRGLGTVLSRNARVLSIGHRVLSLAGGMLICILGLALYGTAN